MACLLSLKIAPRGMSEPSIYLATCGSSSIENALKIAFIKYMVWTIQLINQQKAHTDSKNYQEKIRGDREMTEEESSSCMLNQVYCVLCYSMTSCSSDHL